MTTQFLHIDGYSLSRKRGKFSASGILAEAARVPSACRHLDAPQPPIIRFGRSPTEIEAVLRDRVAAGHDRLGRAVSVASLVLMTAVASWPEPTDVTFGSPESRARYEAWRSLTIGFFRQLWGDALLGVVEHVDEPYPHLHLFAVPPLDPTGVLTVETISEPHRVQAEKRRAGGSRAEYRQAFRGAAVDLQDAYYAAVGAPCGLDRIGPRRLRLTRAEVMARRRAQEAERKAEAERQAEWVRREAEMHREMDAYRARCAAETADQINADREASAALRTRAADEIRRVQAENDYLREELARLGWEPPGEAKPAR
ncbi:hypothetical protein [Pinisolibacter sp.]|uniref:hypothetical protein n=1 Tax=Pinisolibacter sp. TaxID=2172024 RepID=UPI002FDE4022